MSLACNKHIFLFNYNLFKANFAIHSATTPFLVNYFAFKYAGSSQFNVIHFTTNFNTQLPRRLLIKSVYIHDMVASCPVLTTICLICDLTVCFGHFKSKLN